MMSKHFPMEVRRAARKRHFEQMVNRHSNAPSSQPQSMTIGSVYDDLVLTSPDDCDFINQEPNFIEKPDDITQFEFACRGNYLSIIMSIIFSKARTTAFLHYGLTLALRAGSIDVADYLLKIGAPVVRKTPENILSAPEGQKIPLFELLMKHKRWNPNTPGHYGEVLLPRVVTNHAILRWFLENGANPNFGKQRYNRDRIGGPEIDSCDALERAAAHGDAEAVRMLLNKGANISNGVPLHCAAGACQAYTRPDISLEEFEERITEVMELLVQHEADVNQRDNSRYNVPRYPILRALKAGKGDRVRWLLQQGANPVLGGMRDDVLAAAGRT